MQENRSSYKAGRFADIQPVPMHQCLQNLHVKLLSIHFIYIALQHSPDKQL